MADKSTVLQQDASGHYSLTSVARNDIEKIDISDVDLVLTTKSGEHYILPGAGVAAMGDHPPSIAFSDGSVSAAQLLGEVGAVLNLAIEAPMPSSIKLEGDKKGGTKEAELAQQLQKLQHQLHDQQKQLHDQQQKIQDQQKKIQAQDQQQHQNQDQHQSQVSALTVNTEATVEQMVQNLQQLEDNLHKSDYDYVPPHQYDPIALPPAPPPGVPPPISLTPIVNLFMGNVVGTTVVTDGGTTYYYGGGGALNSDASANIGPRDALQWSAATITGDNGNDVIYAEGPLVGNANPSVSNSTYYAKEFLLNVAGYFITLNDVTIKGVPAGVSISGATSEGGGVWVLPASYVLHQQAFTLVYDTGAFNPAGGNTFTLEFDISGLTTRHAAFQSVQTFEFEYMDVTNVSQITNPTLVYDDGGISKEIYVLPTLDQPNIITAGDGNDVVYGSRSNDTITLGNGNDQITEGSGNDVITTGSGNSVIVAGDGANSITVGDGANTITLGAGNNLVVAGNGANTISTGDGNNTITVGSGADTITTGAGNNIITTAGGGGSISTGQGNQTITINSASGSANAYTITTTGSGTTNIAGGDDNYTITTGTGTNTIALGAGNDNITTLGGGGSISTGQGNQTVTINSASGSANALRITTAGTGNSTIGYGVGYAGDNNYTIILGSSGTNNVSIGNGTSSITETGSAIDNIITGNGIMTIAAGAGVGDSLTIGNGTTVADTFAVSVGNGAGDHVTTYGSSGSSGTVAIGTGNNDVVNAGLGNVTVTVGGANGVTNTLALTAGSGDSVTVGGGNDKIYLGSHASGTDTVTLGNGNDTVYVGTGTNTITGGTGSNSLNFSNLTSALTVSFGATGTSTATGTGISDSFTGFNTLYAGNGTNTITLNSGTLTVYGGSGADAITLGSGADTVYGGGGNNIFTGTNLTTSTGDLLVGGTGNNIFTNPDAGTTYNGTNGAALTAVANNQAYTLNNTSATNPFVVGSTATVTNATIYSHTNSVTHTTTSVIYSYANGVTTINFDLGQQINEVSYAASAAGNLTINLSSGQGSGGAATGSLYSFTPSQGYSTINAVIGNGYGDTLTPSYDDSILFSASSTSVGGGDAVFNDGNTLASQTIINVGVATATSSGGLLDTFYMGPASEIIVGNATDGNRVAFGWNLSTANASNSAGVVVNFDDASHTFSNTLFSGSVAVAAYSGVSWGTVKPTSSTYGFNVGTSSLSWSNGDYFVPVNGTSTNITSVMGSNNYANLIYGGTNYVTYYAGGSGGNFFYAGSGGSTYQMNGGWGVADVLTPGGTNIFITHNDAYNNSTYNMYVILNKALDTGSQSSKDSGVSLSFGGTTYTGFAYGWGNFGVGTPVGNALTYISGYENIVGYGGNDYIVGDNNGDQINAETGSNTIILGSGTNIVSLNQGSDTITSSSASGQTIGTNTLNFETASDSYSGVLAGYSFGNSVNNPVEAFLNYTASSTQSTFFGTGGDATAFMGGAASNFQIETAGSTFSTVQAGIISTINGSDYSSGTANSALAASAASSSTNATFVFDNVYSGAKTIIGHAGADIFIDNIGTAAETFIGSSDTSNIYYLSSTQVPDVTITGNYSHLNILRVEGWGAGTSGVNAFGATDPFSTTKITGITEIDARSGTDSVTNSTTVTLGAGSTSHTGTFNLSAGDIQNITGVSGTPTLILKLDSGETFTPTGTVSTVVSGSTTSYYNSATHNSTTLIATDTHNVSLYYSDIVVFNSTNTAHVNIHYGSG